MHFEVDASTIFIGLAGSHAYGLARPGSDVDLRGCVIAPRRIRESFYLHFEQFQAGQQVGAWGTHSTQALAALAQHSTGGPALVACGQVVDVCLFAVSKLVKLAAAGNPNILELLFLDEREVLFQTRPWQRLRDHRDLFLSKRCRHTYAGYAHSQLKRIRGHRDWLLDPPQCAPSRSEFGLPERSVLSADDRDRIEAAVRKIVSEWRLEDGLDGLPTGAELDGLRARVTDFYSATLGCPLEQLEGKLLQLAGTSLEISQPVLAVLDQERRYRSALRGWQQYQRWQAERNPARASLEARHGYDTKHGAHLIRLMRTGLEIMREGVLRVRRPDAEELAAIRKGALDYDELLQLAAGLESELDSVARYSGLPASPDAEAIDRLFLDILMESD